ncbi:MAG TPA: thioredoxin fold domain-containing protein [Balneolaceae bacterium]|nr:thioredoxin fold domain-containing protein [Balneolaceae bacterium]
MKNLHLITLLILIYTGCFFSAAEAQISKEVPFRIMELEEAMETAKLEDKKVLLDVFAVWCPYCRKMHNDVYPNESVSEAVNDHFILVHIDIESQEKVTFLDKNITQAQFANALRSQSTPTTYFMNHDGEILGHQPGLLSADVFESLLRYVGSDAYLDQSFEEYSDQLR